MRGYHYVGLDVHKKSISYCVKKGDGTVVSEGKIGARRQDLDEWLKGLPKRWIGGMEATMFTGWVYDYLEPHAVELKVGHPLKMKAITAAKHKSDALDAGTISDLLRCNLFPECWMVPQEIRDLRRVLRYRNLLVREAVRMRNREAGILMECGLEYDKKRLHGKKYFRDLMESLDDDTPRTVKELLVLTRSNYEIFDSGQKRLVKELEQNEALRERIERLMSIPGVGVVTALTWALEIGDPNRFPTVKDAQSYCGLCAGRDESAGKSKRGPLSKQRNAHLQTMLVEAAKLAPRHNPQLAAAHQKEMERSSNPNRATLAVARKLVAYLLCVDKSGEKFELRDSA